MTDITIERDARGAVPGRKKFQDPDRTAGGETRAAVAPGDPGTRAARCLPFE